MFHSVTSFKLISDYFGVVEKDTLVAALPGGSDQSEQWVTLPGPVLPNTTGTYFIKILYILYIKCRMVITNISCNNLPTNDELCSHDCNSQSCAKTSIFFWRTAC